MPLQRNFKYFNSIKVQLKRLLFAHKFERVVQFQFHKGTIKTHCF